MILRGDEPILVIMKDESKPVAAPGLPTTRPPKSTSVGAKERNGRLLTSLPWSAIGNEFEYCPTPLTVEMRRELVLTPGLTEVNDPPVASWMLSCVKFQVTGKENVSPVARLPCGREELLA